MLQDLEHDATTRLWIGLALFLAMLVLVLPDAASQAQAPLLAFRSPSNAANGGTTKRVQTDLARQVESWRGSRGCGSLDRARPALKPVVARWLGTQIMANPGKRLAAWGYHSGDIWTEDRIIDGKPACSAGFRKLIAYADFR